MCVDHNIALVSHVNTKLILAAALVTKREVSASTKVSALTLILDSSRGTGRSSLLRKGKVKILELVSFEGYKFLMSFLWSLDMSVRYAVAKV